MLGLLFIFSASNGDMAVQRRSCHLHSWIHTIRMPSAWFWDDIVLRIIA